MKQRPVEIAPRYQPVAWSYTERLLMTQSGYGRRSIM